MGAEFMIESLEDIRDLMCNNRVPKEPRKRWYIFTFGCGQEHAGKYVKIWGTYEEARQKMIDRYGDKWAFQYSEENWEKMKADIHRMYIMETELEVIG